MSAEKMAKLKAKLKRVNAANVRARAMICDAAGIPHDADILDWIGNARARIKALEDASWNLLSKIDWGQIDHIAPEVDALRKVLKAKP